MTSPRLTTEESRALADEERRREWEARQAWSITRLNADRDRHEGLARALRDAWKSGDHSWLDLAGIAIQALKPGRADADAVFTVELQPQRSSVRVQASWGGEPADLLDRAIQALEAERAALAACPRHAALTGSAGRVVE